jgi:hypothetical protein
MKYDKKEVEDIRSGLFAVTDSIVEHYESKAVKMFPVVVDTLDKIVNEIRVGDVDGLIQARLWLQNLRDTSMDKGESDYESITKILDVIVRMQKAAQLMEALK